MIRVLYNGGAQTIEHHPAKAWTGTPTYAIEDLGYPIGDADRDVASGNATTNAASEATTAAAGPGEISPAKLSVAATAEFSIGDHCIVTDPDGQAEAFELARISTNAYLQARAPLLGSYPTGSIVTVPTLSASFPAANANDEDQIGREFRVVWTYTLLDGTVERIQRQIRIVRHVSADVDLTSIVRKLRAAYPDLPKTLRDDEPIEDLVEFCVGEVKAEFTGKGIDDARLLLGDRWDDLVLARVVLQFARRGTVSGNWDLPEFYKHAAGVYAKVLEDVLVGNPGLDAVELDGDDNAGAARDNAWSLKL